MSILQSMCFSAEVSFTASVVLGSLGVVSIVKAKKPASKVFALIPVFFSLQQASEGVLWVVLGNPEYQNLQMLFTYLFLSFAWFVWPLIIPISVWMLEKKPKRKIVLSWFSAIGVIVVCILIGTMILSPIDVKVTSYHIKYSFGMNRNVPLFFTILYITPTVISLLVSSVRFMWLLGIVNILSYLLTKIYFHGHLISVWCFFGAISSIIVLWIIIKMEDESK